MTGATRLDARSPASQAYLTYLEAQHRRFAAACKTSVPEAELVHSLKAVFGGVSLVIPADRLAALEALPGVAAVYPDELLPLLTERSPGFIGAPVLWDALGGSSTAGEGVIVAAVDTGVWPEHLSFADPDPLGNPYPPPPVRWAGSGTGAGCDFGNEAANPDDAPFACNNKLLGAYDFTATYHALVGTGFGEFLSARDSDGHGSHTLSTAAGNGGVVATLLGTYRGFVSGIAPRAHAVAYKACGAFGCMHSDTAAAIQQAVLDGVDVINYSIGGGLAPYSDPVSLAMLDAYNAGVLVIVSAGNSGPEADTVQHREPWTLSVGASTTDRHFLSTVTLVAADGDSLVVEGASVTAGIASPTPVVRPPPGREQCRFRFVEGTFDGEIVLCDRGSGARIQKSYNVAAGGAAGLLFANLVTQGIATDTHFVPTVHLEDSEAAALKDFLSSHGAVTATFTGGATSSVAGDRVAAFSSRGGPGQILGVSKPDITAPGVQILAAHTPLPLDFFGGPPEQLFQAIQGTSMATPHATGAAALLKALHPDWTPGLQLVRGSVVGAVEDADGGGLTFEGLLHGNRSTGIEVTVAAGASPFGYVPLSSFGTFDIGLTDDTIANFDVPVFRYGGKPWDRIGVVSNGYVVVGGGTWRDVAYAGSHLPDPAAPNNVLAPFWTDLDPSRGGKVMVAILSDGSNRWIVAEWESVPNYSGGQTNTAQIWLRAGDVEDVSFVYGPDVSAGNQELLVVGAENKLGDHGGAVAVHGAGTLPAPGLEVGVVATPGRAGQTHVITFEAVGKRPGLWAGCAEMTSFFGTSIACADGVVVD